jgi:hypothetical protein
MYDFVCCRLSRVLVGHRLAATVSFLPSQRRTTLLSFQTSKRTGLRPSPVLNVAASRDLAPRCNIVVDLESPRDDSPVESILRLTSAHLVLTRVRQ